MKSNKKIKETKIVGEEALEIKKFIIIFIITIILLGLIALGTSFLVKNRESSNKVNEDYPATFQYANINAGMILNRPYKEYYVMVYDFTDSDADYYSTLIGRYVGSEKAKKVYTCDLDNNLNRKYVAKDGNSNPKAKKVDDFSFGKATLLKIKDGKIVSYIEQDSEIEKVLH